MILSVATKNIGSSLRSSKSDGKSIFENLRENNKNSYGDFEQGFLQDFKRSDQRQGSSLRSSKSDGKSIFENLRENNKNGYGDFELRFQYDFKRSDQEYRVVTSFLKI